MFATVISRDRPFCGMVFPISVGEISVSVPSVIKLVSMQGRNW